MDFLGSGPVLGHLEEVNRLIYWTSNYGFWAEWHLHVIKQSHVFQTVNHLHTWPNIIHFPELSVITRVTRGFHEYPPSIEHWSCQIMSVSPWGSPRSSNIQAYPSISQLCIDTKQLTILSLPQTKKCEPKPLVLFHLFYPELSQRRTLPEVV